MMMQMQGMVCELLGDLFDLSIVTVVVLSINFATLVQGIISVVIWTHPIIRQVIVTT
jgi:hypothetical protein